MNLSDKILAQLREEYRSGMTQQEIAKAHNVTHPQIQRLLSGQRDCGGLTVDTVSKMFPNATINLHGDPEPSGMDRLRQDVEHIQQLNREAKAAARAEITNQIMSSHLPSDVKVQVWAVINGTPSPSSSPMPPTVAVRAVGTSRPGVAARRAGSSRARISALLRENKPGKK